MAWYILGTPARDSYQPVFRWRNAPAGNMNQKIGCGSPATAAELPTVAVQEENGRPIPDFVRIKGTLAVPAAFRDIVNRLEPGVHQFFPIKLCRPSGDFVEKEYFVLNVCLKIEALIIEKSNVEWSHWKAYAVVPGLGRAGSAWVT